MYKERASLILLKSAKVCSTYLKTVHIYETKIYHIQMNATLLCPLTLILLNAAQMIYTQLC